MLSHVYGDRDKAWDKERYHFLRDLLRITQLEKNFEPDRRSLYCRVQEEVKLRSDNVPTINHLRQLFAEGRCSLSPYGRAPLTV